MIGLNNYFQQSLNMPSSNFYLSFPAITMMENQIKNEEIELEEVKLVSESNSLSNNIHQVILGSLLGDMCCRREAKNSLIQECHSIKQKEYLLWKHSILKNDFNVVISFNHNTTCKFGDKIYQRRPQIGLRSRVSNKLNYYHTLFYGSGKKRVSDEILNQLCPLGLAVWYCDDGHYDNENKTVQIHTEGFSLDENRMIKEWFYRKWNIRANFKKSPSKKNLLLRFPKRDSEKFLNIVRDHIFSMPESIWYKLGTLWEGNLNAIKSAQLNKKRRTKLYQSREEVKVRRNFQGKEFYQNNKERLLKEKNEYQQTERHKNYVKEYNQREHVKIRRREREKTYRQNLDYKMKRAAYQKRYHQRPEIKEKVKEYNQRAREKKKRGKIK